jgi:hypothetical protein
MLEVLLGSGLVSFGALVLAIASGFWNPRKWLEIRSFGAAMKKPVDAVQDLHSWKRQRRREDQLEWERRWAQLAPPEDDPTLVSCDICGQWHRDGLPAESHRQSHLGYPAD